MMRATCSALALAATLALACASNPPTNSSGNTGNVAANAAAADGHSSAASDSNKKFLAGWKTSHADPRYPTAKFLIGIGGGNDATEAADQGRRDLLANFETEIDAVVESLSSTAVETVGDAGASVTESYFSKDKLVAKVSGNIKFAEVAQTILDDESGQYFALVVIDRAKFCDDLARKIGERGAELKAAMESADELISANRFLTAYSVLAKHQESFVELDAWFAQFNFANKTAGRARPDVPVTSADYLKKMLACGRELTFCVVFDCQWEDQAGAKQRLDAQVTVEAVKGAVEGMDVGAAIMNAPELAAMSTADIRDLAPADLKARAGGANFLIVGDVTTVFSSMFGQSHVYRSEFTARIIDVNSGEEWAADISGGGKGQPHATPRIAAQNALSGVSKAIAEKVAEAIRK